MGEEEEDEENRLPKSIFRPAPKIPNEIAGQNGANKYTYFVCNEPGEKWTRLPSVTPEQIQTARKIKKYFTGNLNAAVNCFPNFNGNETNLLRAQIARISAGTTISPIGYFQFDEEEEIDDEDGMQMEFVQNQDYEGLPVKELADHTMQNWVHTRSHILKQGRCVWWNPRDQDDNDEEEVDEDEEEEVNDAPEQEIGPPLLTSVADDNELDSMLPWTTRLSSSLRHVQHTVCVVKSNLWPGAFAVSDGHFHENIYIGWGVKHTVDNFTPASVDPFNQECPVITQEIQDPTVEDEVAFEKTQNQEGEEEEGDGMLH